jgi:hypothetical protein
MLFDRLFRRGPKPEAKEPDPLNQGVFYFYLIIGLQAVFVFALMLAIMFIGNVIATPLWVFGAVLILGTTGMVYVYRKAKRQLQRFRETLQSVHPSGRNYEISVMGGMLTMRVEQNSRRLLEAGPSPEPVIDSEAIETPAPR